MIGGSGASEGIEDDNSTSPAEGIEGDNSTIPLPIYTRENYTLPPKCWWASDEQVCCKVLFKEGCYTLPEVNAYVSSNLEDSCQKMALEYNDVCKGRALCF